MKLRTADGHFSSAEVSPRSTEYATSEISQISAHIEEITLYRVALNCTPVAILHQYYYVFKNLYKILPGTPKENQLIFKKFITKLTV